MAANKIYQFYAELNDFKPKIWRRFQVTNNVTIARLGYIVMTLFEMTASHLFAIKIRKIEGKPSRPIIYRYVIMDETYEPLDAHHIKEADMRYARLCDELNEVGEQCEVNYDFGDNWIVNVTLEKIFVDKELPSCELPRVLEGKGFGIIEDCGGTSGLDELVKAFKKKKGESYKQFSKWLDMEDFDVHTFDIDDMNFRLKKVPRIYKQCYEDGLYPSKKSNELLDREYLKK